MIVADRVTFAYEAADEPALRRASLTVREGEYVGLIGANGCGKTTLIRQLNALLLPGEGSVTVDGLDTRDRGAVAEIRRRVGMSFQNPEHQIVGMTVEEDVAFGPGNMGLPPQELRRRVDDALAAVGIPALGKRLPHTLSGGEKRLVTIAGVIAMDPRYIAFDEPSAYLDPAARRRVLALIRSLNRERGIGIVHVAHDAREIVHADRVVVMEAGAVREEGTPRDIFTRRETLRGLGLDAPPAVEILDRLREAGVGVRGGAVTLKEASREIAAHIREMQPGGKEQGR
ncbi:MAG: ATP-binding cassette domain-containing protein [Syntrophales bacterium]|jgi:biotin transport system ATP-binding protein/energy-coupling factor transport system ATP-binding protein|nr:ATP-binding cassette domain-containing protein [Syntrophales bacterium]